MTLVRTLSLCILLPMLYYRVHGFLFVRNVEQLRTWINRRINKLETLLRRYDGPSDATRVALCRIGKCIQDGGDLGFSWLASRTGISQQGGRFKPYLRLAQWRLRSVLVALHHESEHHRLIEEFRNPIRHGALIQDPIWLREKEIEAVKNAYGVDLALLDYLRLVPSNIECRMEMVARWRSEPRVHILAMLYLIELLMQPLIMRRIKPLAMMVARLVCSAFYYIEARRVKQRTIMHVI